MHCTSPGQVTQRTAEITFYQGSNFSSASWVIQHFSDWVINLSSAEWEPLGWRSLLLRLHHCSLSPHLAFYPLPVPFCWLLEQMFLWESAFSCSSSSSRQKPETYINKNICELAIRSTQLLMDFVIIFKSYAVLQEILQGHPSSG